MAQSAAMRTLTVVVLVALVAAPVLAVIQTDPSPTSTTPFGSSGVDTPATNLTAAYYSGLLPLARVDPGDVRDITLRGDHAFTAGHSGIRIFDISDPASPVEVGFIFCPSRDLVVVGDVLAAVAENGAGECSRSSGVHIIDISDLTSPTFVKHFSIPAHTITAFGETGYIHVASSDLVPDVGLSSGFQDILFAPTPEDAIRAKRYFFPAFATNGQPVNAPSCHEITFSVDLTRGYCAGITETHIWDMADPVNPKVVSVIANPSITIHHGAFVDADKEILVLNDEFLGVLTSLADGCLPAGGKTPVGALWFYDVTDEATPVPLSWVEVASNRVGPYYCTSHFGNILPNDEQLVWGWYSAGPVLVDFQDVLDPRVLASEVVSGGRTWGAYYHDGHVYTGDIDRGFEVFSLV